MEIPQILFFENHYSDKEETNDFTIRIRSSDILGPCQYDITKESFYAWSGIWGLCRNLPDILRVVYAMGQTNKPLIINVETVKTRRGNA